MSELLSIPVKAGNDANVAALGEMWKGGGEGYLDVVLLTLGTGVGGGIIINGEIAPSHRGVGGELGHITVNPDDKSIFSPSITFNKSKAFSFDILFLSRLKVMSS